MTRKKEDFIVILQDTEAVSREIWLKERKKAVCASDYPAIVGLSSFKTPVDIFEDKIDPDAISEEVTLGTKFRYDIGHALEPVILETIALEIGAIPVRDKRMVESTRYPYMRADIDGLFVMNKDRVICGTQFYKGEQILFEGKTTSFTKFMDYRKAPDPAHVAQSKFGMLVRGLDHCIIGYSCGGNNLDSDLVYHICHLTDEDRETIPMIVKDFWEKNVMTRTPPSEALGPYASSFKQALIRYLGKTAANDGQVLQLPLYAAPIIQNSLAIREEISRRRSEIRELEEKRDSIELPLVNLLGDKYQSAILESTYQQFRIGFSVSERESLTAESLARLKKEQPLLYETLVAQGYIQTNISRSFSVKSKEKKMRTTRKKRGA